MLRVCVVGSGGVGKSCVTLRFLKDEFTEYYDPTMGKFLYSYLSLFHSIE